MGRLLNVERLLLLIAMAMGLGACKASLDIADEASNLNYLGCTSATALSSQSIQVDFDFPSDADQVDIFRDGVLVSTSTLSSLTTIVDKDLREGQSYRYTCSAVFKGQTKAGANDIEVSTLAFNAPGFAGIQSATALSPHSARLTWNEATPTGAAPAYFKVYGHKGSSIDWSNETTRVESGFFTTLEGLGDEIPYTFSVRACTYNDLCDANTATINLAMADDGPSTTVGITNVVPANGQVTITAPWKESDGAVLKRKVYYRTGATGGTNLANYTLDHNEIALDLANPPTSIVVTGILENTQYHFIVHDEDPSGNLNPSIVPYSIFIGDLTAPLFSGISALNNGTPADTQIVADFTAVAHEGVDAQGPNRYLVYMNTATFPTIATDACQSGATLHETLLANAYTNGQSVNHNINALTERTSYNICIKAQDSSGNISNTLANFARTTQDITSPVFDGMQSVNFNIGTGNIDLVWLGSSTADVDHYEIKVWKNTTTPTPGDITTLVRSHGTNPNGMAMTQADFSFGDLDTVYAVANACDDANIIPGGAKNCTAYPTDATAKKVTLPDVTAPIGFAGVEPASSLNSAAEGQMTVPWFEPTWTPDYFGFRIYHVEPDDSLTLLKDCPCATPGSCNSGDVSCTITGLNAFRTYKFHVRAYDAIGNETQLNVTTKTSPKLVIDTTAPNFISGLTIGAAPTYTLAWSTATDNQYASEPGADIDYEVYRKDTTTFTDPNNPALDGGPLATINVTNYTDATVAMGVDYFYTICAVDGSGNRTCDGNVKSLNIADNLKPIVIGLTHDKVDDSDKDWDVTWTNFDNVAVVTVNVYKKITDSAEALTIANIGDPGVTLEASGGSALASLLGETGPANANKYINYLVVLADAASNQGEASISVYSKNTLTLTSIGRNVGSPAGGKMVRIVGDGFVSGATVTIDGQACTNPDTGTNFAQIINDKNILCITPAQTGGATVDVVVTNPDTTTGTLSNGYTYSSVALCDNPGSWGTDFAGGTGTGGDPYVVCDGNHLNNLDLPAYVNTNKFFELQDNINLDSFNPIPASPDFPSIGTLATQFNGTVNGNSFTLSNYKHDDNATNSVALFGVMSNGGLSNFDVVNFDINGSTNAGIIIGSSSGTASFNNITIHGGEVSCDQSQCGTFAGSIVGGNITISNIHSDATVTQLANNRASVAGLVGRTYGTHFSNVSFSGLVDMIGWGQNIGGIYGQDHPCVVTTITNATFSGIIQGRARKTGGIAGTAGTTSMSNVASTGIISTTEGDETGGIAGQSNPGCGTELVIEEAYVTGSVSNGGTYGSTGGIIGNILNNSLPTNLRDIYVQGNIFGPDEVGGAIGQSVETTSAFINLERVYVTGKVTGATAGGLVADDANSSVTVTDSFWYYDATTPTLGTTQPTSVGGGTAKTLVEMQTQATFDPPWDFTTIWEISPSSFPNLQWEP